MKIALIIISLLFLLSLYVIWEEKTTNHIKAHDLTLRIKAHKDSANSLANRFKARIAEDSLILIRYGETVQRANLAEQRALKAERNLKHEINTHRTFSDHQTDSLLATIQPH